MLQADHDNRIPLSRIQRLIGSLMHRAKREGAFFYLECMADLTELTEMRKAYSRSVGVRVTTNDFFFRAMALEADCAPLASPAPAISMEPLTIARVNIQDTKELLDRINPPRRICSTLRRTH